ncbi:DedA family protein [Cellulomonas sp. KRMCY2]|uniref:DedA family protein n=1 Tax=Cellulomonas sp. KRMCY2 TaxID=1304865 RepID=UPI00045E6B98|nr:DedA family protein [Cellulomonas sp. KRMCY2]
MDAWLLSLAASPLVYLGMFLFAVVDGFFPPIPSEAAALGLAALSVATGKPNLALVLLVAAAGAFTGDQVAYAIGQRLDVRRFPLLRSGRGRKSLIWAEQALTHRGPSFILAARFIPIARVAVNMTAGAVGYPRRRFVWLAALSSVTWAAYSAVIGVGAGAWLQGNPWGAVAVGVVGGLVIGVVVDWALTRLPTRRVRVDVLVTTSIDETGARPAPVMADSAIGD